MNYNDLLFLCMIYAIISILMLLYTFSKSKCEEKLKCITLARLMYLLIFGIIPLLVHFHVYTNGVDTDDLLAFDYSSKGIKQFYLASLFSVVGFWGLNAGYRYIFTFGVTRYFDNEHIQINGDGEFSYEYPDSVLFVSGVIMFIIGLFSLLLWTKAYGGVKGILEYASAIRSGWDTGIDNSYTVFKRFAPLLQFASLIFFGLWVKRKNIIDLVLFIAAVIFSVYYLLANDGRAPTVVYFVSIIWLWTKCRDKTKERRSPNYVFVGVLAIVALFAMHNYDTIYSYISKGTELELSFDIFESIRSEFSFTVRNIQAVFLALDDNPFMFKLPTEILNGILGILPSSFRPDWIENLEKFNTSYWVMNSSRTYYGGKPPDIITTGIYTMNYLGVFFLPLIYGQILRKLDSYFGIHDGLYANILFANLLYPVVRTIGYANFNGVTLNVFYILAGCLIIWFVGKLSWRRGYDEV